MSAPSSRLAWLRELTVPLLLLGVYTVCFGLYSLHRETSEGVRHIQTAARRRVAVEMTQLQANLDYLLRAGNLPAVRESLSGLGYNPQLEVGLLVDEQQAVLASTRLALIGKPLREAWPEGELPENVGRRQQALEQLKGVVELSTDGRRIIGHYPVQLSFGPSPRRMGYLFFQHDLTELERAGRYSAERSVLRSTLMLLAIAGCMGLGVHFLLGRRIQRLVATTEGMAEQIGHSRRQLRENEERFQMLVERTPDAIFIHREGSIVFLNPAAATLVGHERAEALQGRRLTELVQPGEEGALTGPEVAQGMREVHWVHRSGGLVLGEVVTFSLVFEGQPAWVSIVRDITERKHLREKLQTADRMASIGSLAAGVAHEINNPLSFMLSNVRFIRDELRVLAGEGDAQAKERLKEVQEALEEALTGADRVSDIVRDLRTFARGDDGQRVPVNLHAVLDLCGNIARSQLRHRAQLVKEYGELPLVNASESRLGQLFLNLIINAAQAIPEGGDVKAHEVKLTTWREGEDQVVVEVKDTGVGIPAENLHRLFDPFFTTKPVGVGTGLGLSISHGIVKAMGGRITVQSEPGKGTAFRVFLPIGEPVAAPVSPGPA
ncbi:two-component system sensor histidine kinase NtrB [Hyalangium sp.]|uniref:two-component system sensor histidine kinase NtrB n=1 Tax=Hyalangium sp. TaxID=2028555 RepID=UPI002D2B9938|nr:ATP-binding protein [Hyalangium sp.]HYI03107.1 ATP-binding protein [Hyalangium sp.]